MKYGFQVGLGYRRALHQELLAAPHGAVDFLELAPENYLGLGGEWRRRLDAVRERWPLVCHGLAMSLGGSDPLDLEYLAEVASFVEDVGSPWYSDHLSVGRAHGHHTHELLPVEMTPQSVERTARRVVQVAAALSVPMAVENVSAYGRWPGDTMEEPEFVCQVVEAAQCGFLLDVNNVLVNAINFGHDPLAYLERFPLEATLQIHVAGFERRAPDLVIDTHGEDVDDAVWPLLEVALHRTGPVPVLLERDNNIPPLSELLQEVALIREVGSRVFQADP